MLNYIQYLEQRIGIPALAVTFCVILFFVLQLIGELLEFKGKIVPEFLKVRKLIKRRKQERIETQNAIKDVREALAEVNSHYSTDNITKRNGWMQWVNDRVKAYDQSIIEIKKDMAAVTDALNANTQMTEGIFIQSCRDRILDFAARVSNTDAIVSREEFNRILKVYNEYETFLREHNRTNGEIDIAYRIINEAYAARLKNSSFIEDMRGYR